MRTSYISIEKPLKKFFLGAFKVLSMVFGMDAI